MTLLKTLILWADMIVGCVSANESVIDLELNIYASAPDVVGDRDVTLSADLKLHVDSGTLDCLSSGLADLGW